MVKTRSGDEITGAGDCHGDRDTALREELLPGAKGVHVHVWVRETEMRRETETRDKSQRGSVHLPPSAR